MEITQRERDRELDELLGTAQAELSMARHALDRATVQLGAVVRMIEPAQRRLTKAAA
jgi:hypothetical protein